MSAWSRTRQLLIITYIVLVALVIAAIVYFLVLYKPPSCFDGVQNGYEEGVDCGGGCQLVCSFSATTPNVVWARSFEIGNGVYNFAAEVENPNFDVGTSIEYVFRGYNDENILVSEINDMVTLYPKEKRIIFVPSVQTGNQSVSRVFLEFGDNGGWYNIEPTPDRIRSAGYQLNSVDTTPSLVVDLRNSDVRPVRNLTVMAVLYDQNENIEQVSQTYVEEIPADSIEQAFFSWRKPFDNTVEQVEVFVLEPRE